MHYLYNELEKNLYKISELLGDLHSSIDYVIFHLRSIYCNNMIMNMAIQ
jgi:hypothetical protein